MRRPLAIANQHPRLRLDRHALARVIATLDAHPAEFNGGCRAGELSLAFFTDGALAQLHADFLDDPTITDVITFEGNPDLGTAGEICVSVDAALRHVKLPLARGRRAVPAARLAAFSDELTLYVVHGWLHLAGYDDLQPAKKRIMRRAEARALALLRRAPGGLPRFALK